MASSDPTSPDDLQTLFVYELFAAAGALGHPPVSPEMARMVAETISPERLAQAERLYLAVRQAMQEAGPGEGLEALSERANAILSRAI